jgi:hypothetical protein
MEVSAFELACTDLGLEVRQASDRLDDDDATWSGQTCVGGAQVTLERNWDLQVPLPGAGDAAAQSSEELTLRLVDESSAARIGLDVEP